MSDVAPVRLMARLDIKSGNLIKGVRFEGLRVLGDPVAAARKYYHEGIDEILLIDTVASLYGRPQIGGLVKEVSQATFVPLTVGGGIKTFSDAKSLFDLGADKIAINTASFSNPNLLREIANKYGSQSVVLSLQVTRESGTWFCLVDQGREKTGVSLDEQLDFGNTRNVGEFLITSVDRDGTFLGLDSDLVKKACEATSKPVSIGGGFSVNQDISALAELATLSALAVASELHYSKSDVIHVKNNLQTMGFGVRQG